MLVKNTLTLEFVTLVKKNNHIFNSMINYVNDFMIKKKCEYD